MTYFQNSVLFVLKNANLLFVIAIFYFDGSEIHFKSFKCLLSALIYFPDDVSQIFVSVFYISFVFSEFLQLAVSAQLFYKGRYSFFFKNYNKYSNCFELLPSSHGYLRPRPHIAISFWVKKQEKTSTEINNTNVKDMNFWLVCKINIHYQLQRLPRKRTQSYAE